VVDAFDAGLEVDDSLGEGLEVLSEIGELPGERGNRGLLETAVGDDGAVLCGIPCEVSDEPFGEIAVAVPARVSEVFRVGDF